MGTISLEKKAHVRPRENLNRDVSYNPHPRKSIKLPNTKTVSGKSHKSGNVNPDFGKNNTVPGT
jgi:hypothetical protein